MKAKLVLLFIVILVLASSAYAFGRIFVISLNYNQGEFSINDKLLKYGYYPDNKIQPDDGYYVCEIISDKDELLYSFKFEVPLRIYLDSSAEVTKRLSGGYILLDKVDFALILPYFDNAKEIRIYKPTGKTKSLKLSIDAEDIRLSKANIMVYGSAFGASILLVLLLLLIRKLKNRR